SRHVDKQDPNYPQVDYENARSPRAFSFCAVLLRSPPRPPTSSRGVRSPDGASRVEERRGDLGRAATSRFLSPLIKPDVPISGIRLSDWFHHMARGSGPRCTRRSRSTPTVPKTWSAGNLRVPRPCTLHRLRRQC